MFTFRFTDKILVINWLKLKQNFSDRQNFIAVDQDSLSEELRSGKDLKPIPLTRPGSGFSEKKHLSQLNKGTVIRVDIPNQIEVLIRKVTAKATIA